MTARELEAACRALAGATKEHPFRDQEITVFKVGGKVFAIARLVHDPVRVSLKCDPELAVQLRATYPAIQPGYHLNKRHWNTVTIDGSLPDRMVVDLIRASYGLIVDALPRTRRPPETPAANTSRRRR